MPATILPASPAHNTLMLPRFDNLMHARHGRRSALHALVAIGAAGLLPDAGATALVPWTAATLQRGPLPLDMNGQPRAIPAAGRATIVNFWATWCEPCRTEMPSLQQVADLYGDRLSVVALNFKERAATVQRFVQGTGLTLPVFFDPAGQVAAAHGVKIFPTSLLFDAAGRPRWRVQGALDWTDAKVGEVLEDLVR